MIVEIYVLGHSIFKMLNKNCDITVEPLKQKPKIVEKF